jgi:hypothetical protein
MPEKGVAVAERLRHSWTGGVLAWDAALILPRRDRVAQLRCGHCHVTQIEVPTLVQEGVATIS